MSNSQVECALSGIVPAADAVEETETFTSGPKGLPEGWTEVRITHRRLNPLWESVQETKEITLQQAFGQMDEKARQNVEGAVILQVEANFAALEMRPEYAMTVLDEKVLYIAPSNEVEGLEAEVRKLCTILNIDSDLILAGPEEDDDDDAGADEAPDDAAPEVAPVVETG